MAVTAATLRIERDAAHLEVAELRERLNAVRELHYPRTDRHGSLVTWSFCACGAYETFTAEDGYPATGPARYPCATMRALDGDQ